MLENFHQGGPRSTLPLCRNIQVHPSGLPNKPGPPTRAPLNQWGSSPGPFFHFGRSPHKYKVQEGSEVQVHIHLLDRLILNIILQIDCPDPKSDCPDCPDTSGQSRPLSLLFLLISSRTLTPTPKKIQKQDIKELPKAKKIQKQTVPKKS